VLREGVHLVAVSRPQRREGNLHHTQAKQEVFAKLTPRTHRREVAVRGRHHPQVGAQRLLTAHALEGALLQEPQELRLHRQRQLADLVEEERAPLGALDLAGNPTVGAGKRPALVTKQLALHERRGQRGAIDRDERPFPASAVGVQRPRKHPLARARLAPQEHRRVGGRHPQHLLRHGPHRRRRAHDVVEHPAQLDTPRRPLPRPKRRALQRLRHLPREGPHEGLVLPGEATVKLVEHLQHAPRRAPRVDDGRAEHRARHKARSPVDLGEVPRVARGVVEVDQLARLGHPARHAAPWRQANLVELGQVGHPRAQLARRAVDEVHGRPLGPERLRHAVTDPRQQAVELDLLREQGAQIEEQGELVVTLHRAVGGYHGRDGGHGVHAATTSPRRALPTSSRRPSRAAMVSTKRRCARASMRATPSSSRVGSW
jgi:hypothetical protein